MRAIKFRAWHKKQKEMKGLELSGLCAIHNDWVKYEIMQYTGLKDKNGKEIYEGDIVRLFPGDKLERIDFVQWNEYEAKLSTSNAPSGTLFGGEQIEVIGNIYENGDLLENIQGK